MPFQIIREDITHIIADAIVNPTDNFLSHRGGTDEKIYLAAGKELDKACDSILCLETSGAVITSAYNMTNTKYIIHTCGPVYYDGRKEENELLYKCYENCLRLAKENNIETIAFPLISSGTFGFPKGEALKIATKAITDFLYDNEMFVYLLVYDNTAFDTSKRIFSDVEDFLHPKPVEKNTTLHINNIKNIVKDILFDEEDDGVESYEAITEKDFNNFSERCFISGIEIEEPDEAFYEYLQRILRERGLTDPQVYKKANMDRKLWNNIINGKKKGIRKETAVSIALALEMDYTDTKELIERAGYSFTNYSLFDRIIMACIYNGTYNIFDVNEALLNYDQVTLGSKARDDD